MRVLFVVSGLGEGGAGRQVVLAAKELVRQGHCASIYCLTRDARRLEELADAGVDVVVDAKRRMLDLGVLRRLRRHIGSWAPDIVHGFVYDGDLYARLAAWDARIPVLNSERTDDQAVSPLQRAGYRLTAMLCHGVVANTHAGAAFARRLHRLPRERVDVVWNGIDLEEARERLARSDAPARALVPGSGLKRICMVGSLAPHNDYALAFRALRRLLDEDGSWRLILVGSERPEAPAHPAELAREIGRLGLQPFVTFTGHRKDVLELVASSDLLLISARHGGFPNVALDAMASGVPVVSTEYGDLRRLLPVRAQVVRTRSEQDLAGAVLNCYRRRDHIARAQHRALQREATAAATTAALLGVYAKYCARGEPAGAPV
jgi:glycosyltransferase involved in cell wall biosynthesis